MNCQRQAGRKSEVDIMDGEGSPQDDAGVVCCLCLRDTSGKL